MVNKTEMSFSVPHRIWRIIYPVLLFFSVQVVVTLAVGLTYGFSVMIRELILDASGFDAFVMAEDLAAFIFDKVIIIVLASNVISLFIFIPMWLKTKKDLERYRLDGKAPVALLTAGFFAGFNIVQVFIFSFTDIMQYFPSYENLADLVIGGSFYVQLLSIGVAAPIVEELVFRGILMGRMKWMPVWVAAIVQAALFGIIHMNLFQSLYAFLAGLLLAYVYIKYRSIILAIIGHMAYNLASVILSEYIKDDAAWVMILVFGTGVAVSAVCAVFLVKRKGARSLSAPPPVEPNYNAPVQSLQ